MAKSTDNVWVGKLEFKQVLQHKFQVKARHVPVSIALKPLQIAATTSAVVCSFFLFVSQQSATYPELNRGVPGSPVDNFGAQRHRRRA